MRMVIKSFYSYRLVLNHLINYNRTFGNHSIDATLLAERQRQTTTSSKLSAKDFAAAGTTVLGIHALELGNPEKEGLNQAKVYFHSWHIWLV